MKLTVLGMNGPWPAPGGACSSYLIAHEGVNVLLDAGPGAISRLQEHIPIEKLDAILLTHWHYDHISDILPLQYALAILAEKKRLTHKIMLIAPALPEALVHLVNSPHFERREIAPVELGGLSLDFCGVRHPVEGYAVSILCQGRRFVYSGDSNTSPRLEAFCRGADVLLCDAGILKGEWNEDRPHLSPEKAAEMGARAGVGALVLTHLAPGTCPDDVHREAHAAYPGALVAYPGMTVQL